MSNNFQSGTFIPHIQSEYSGPKISIQEDGYITLRSSIVRKSNIYPSVPPHNVLLYFKEEKRSMAIEPREAKVGGGIRLKRPKENAKTFIFNATRFLRKYNIGHPYTVSYPAEWHPEKGEDGWIIVPCLPIENN